MKSTLQSFSSFSEARRKVLEDRAKLEAVGRRQNEAKRFAELLAEFQVSNVSELDEEKRTQFFAALVGETEELETEGNAFGAAVKKAKEDGEDEFEVDGKKYKVEALTNESFSTEEVEEVELINEAVQVGDKRTAKKVVTQLNRIFTKQLPDLQQMGKTGIYGCVKYFLDYAMTDANFHTEKPAVMKTIKKANIPGIEVKLPGLGDYHAKISGGRIKEILHQYASQISNAAGWSGQGVVEGCALYLSTFQKDDATATAMINAFNAQFEGEAVRVDVTKKSKALNEGRAFVAAVMRAREAGEETFEFNGKTYNVTKAKNVKKVNEAEIKDDESFKEYVKATYSKAFGEDYDEEKATKAAEGMLKKADGDYGAAVGMVKASLG